MIGPVRCSAATARAMSAVTPVMSNVPVTSPLESSVDVDVPSTTSAVYVLPSAVRNRKQPRGLADADQQHPGRIGIERAGVADLALVEAPAQHADDVVTGDSCRLVDHRQPVGGGRLTSRHLARFRPAPSRSVGLRRSLRHRRLVVQDPLDALGRADHLVGPERQDRRLLRPDLAADRRLQPHAMARQRREDVGVAVLAQAASRSTRWPGSSPSRRRWR